MRLVMLSLAAMTASTACLGLLFLYALFVSTVPAPSAAIVDAPDVALAAPAQPPLVNVASEVR
jgi:hypothetical protein